MKVDLLRTEVQRVERRRLPVAHLEAQTFVEAEHGVDLLDGYGDVIKSGRWNEPRIDKLEREYDEFRNTMLKAGLSGVGLAIIFHEVEQGVRALCDQIEEGGEREAIRIRAHELAGTLEGFADLLRKGKRLPNSLTQLIRRVRDINRVRFRKRPAWRAICPPPVPCDLTEIGGLLTVP